MFDRFVFAVEGLEDLRDLDGLTPAISLAATRAINSTLIKARTLSAREMRNQVRFPKNSLEGENGLLRISQRATTSRFEGVITGRRRATSLARFVTSSGSRKKGLSVEVKPGRSIHLPNAFLIPLRSGQSGVLGNKGLAIRTKTGERPSNAYKPVKLRADLWLLYGPSVDQVFRTVREDVRPDVESYLEAEFLRLLDLEI